MKFYEKINHLAESLALIKEKLNSVAVDFLSEEESIEYYKIMQLIDFNINTLVEFVMQDNIEYIKENKLFVREVLDNIENFINDVNNNLNI